MATGASNSHISPFDKMVWCENGELSLSLGDKGTEFFLFSRIREVWRDGDQRVIPSTSTYEKRTSILLTRKFKSANIIEYNRSTHLVLRNKILEV